MPPQVSLEDLGDFQKKNALRAPNELPSNGYLFCTDDPFARADDALDKWTRIREDIQAGKGKSMTMQLSPDGGPLKPYKIPLDEIGNKKGEIWTNGKEVQFRQTDGTIWDSKFQLRWKSDDEGGFKFVWK